MMSMIMSNTLSPYYAQIKAFTKFSLWSQVFTAFSLYNKYELTTDNSLNKRTKGLIQSIFFISLY